MSRRGRAPRPSASTQGLTEVAATAGQSQARVRKDVNEMSEERFQGQQARSLPRPNKRYGAGRVCAAPGCPTKLSIYNKWDYCWQHEPVHTYIARGKRRSRKEMEAA
jgi:hypothetical protein